MTSLCLRKLHVAGAFAFIATTIFVACGVPDYNVPTTPEAGVAPTGSGGKTGTSSGGSSSTGGAPVNATGGQAPQLPLNCTSDANCVGLADTKVCDSSVSPGRCVECLPGNKPCPAGSGLYCGTDKECHVGCNADADCGTVVCDASTCPDLTCDLTTHQCTGCVTSADCGVGTKCVAGSCVAGCGTDKDCPSAWTCCQNTACVNLQADEENCLYCGNKCDQPNAVMQCLNGACRLDHCDDNYADCDKNPNNGCEANLHADKNNCGTCGTVCTGTQVCKPDGTCGPPDCTGSYANCDTSNPDCETNTDSDVAHCGSCTNACSKSNDTPSCNAGKCTLTCNTNFGDCDNNVNNGCEMDLTTSSANCGACGAACTNDHGSTSCSASKCVPTCGTGFADCNGNPADGCEAATTTDVNNCNGCGKVCSLPNATAACTNSTCTIATCAPNYADCDNNPANGCETNLQLDPLHCNSCSTACNATNGTATCSAGKCGISCNPGFADCDSNVTNGCEVNLSVSVDHCNACSTICPDQANGTAICKAGVCGVSNCQAPFGDCDGNSANGCEANEDSDPNNCGGCGNKCAIAHATAKCTLGVCGISTCDAGFADCDGNAANGCEVNLNTDTNNCKSCGAKCAPANAVGSCVAGTCTVTSCTGSFQDCDGLASNGCEADVNSNVSNCGRCSTTASPAVCSSVHGTPSCSGGVCNITCAPGFGNCDGNVGNGCETTTTNDAANCNTCGTTCVTANGTAACLNSACTVASCLSGFADCDGKYSNGCEARLTTDSSNCGACNNICNSTNGTASCANGLCSITCTAGFGNCDTLVSNGCEINLGTSMPNCGTCGQACAPANASAACTGGTCAITTCNTGFANCNALIGDGCEINLTSDPNHCNTCSTVCSFANATAGCNSGVCALGACNAGYANCDGTAANGCEINLNTDPTHCNSCSTVCAFTNASATCNNGTCAFGTCNAGFASCDGNTANGCEINTNTDINNCGICGKVCPPLGATATCTAGICGTSTTVCTAPFKDCNGLSTDGCEINSSNDVNNCGGCGTKCTFANAAASCVSSTCTLGACTAGFGNCDGSAANGCEVNLKTDVNNCNTCGTKCTFANASATCNNGTCAMGACNAGYADCDGLASNGCEVNLKADINNCNACGTKCSTTNGTATCNNGTCQIACNPGFADCDLSAANGCEINTNTNTAHCGTCATVCNSTNGTATCTGGVCGITCNGGYGNCDGSAANGCEVNTNTSVNYCGSCSNVCGSANGTPGCSGGVCSIACTAGYGNCDGNFSNGCESILTSDASNCGSCGTHCTYANASGVCSSSACAMGTCNTGYGNCDGNTANGCEVALNTVSNCGTCSNVCGATNATPTCSAGACSEACSPGYGNCNGLASDGCEVVLNTVSNCGTCTTVCSYANATPVCSSGACSMGACSYLYGNCDGNTGNGCERSLAADTGNCGTCGNTCASTNGTASCSAGACSIACTSLWGNCDGNFANGCEKSLATDTANCGLCNHACATGQTCLNGVCQTPCTAYCSSPTEFAGGSFQSGDLGINAFCYETTGAINGGGCSNFAAPRTLSVNGTAMNCGGWTVPARVNGGYCVYGPAGGHTYDAFTTW